MSMFNTESNEPEVQFNNGIKMIVSAYETQNSILSKEISSLNTELEKKNIKILEMENLVKSLLKEKTLYEEKLSSLSKSNSKMTKQLEALLEENKELKTVKDAIIETMKQKKSIKPKIFFSKDKLGEKSSQLLHEECLNGNENEEENTMIIQNEGTILSDRLPKSQSALKKMKKEILKSNYSTINGDYSTKSINKKTFGYTPHANSVRRSSFDKIQMNHSHSTKNLNANMIMIRQSAIGENQHKGNGDFFYKCRNMMSQEDYSDMIDKVKLFNSKKISKEETYSKILTILNKKKYNELINDFESLFL